MSGRVLVIIALFAAGFIFLPQAVSLFAGQHNWYDLSIEQNMLSSDVSCEKCHADIADEMSAHTGPHTGETGYGRMECAQCHRVKLGTYQFAAVGNSPGEALPGEYAHAAATVACMDCHKYVTKKEFDTYTVGGNHAAYQSGDNPYWFQKCEKCHSKGKGSDSSGSGGSGCSGSDWGGKQIPPAGGFGLTNGTGDTGRKAAHLSFINSSMTNGVLKDENEACIGCHTAAPVKINWMHATSLEFEVISCDGISKWDVTDLQINGTANVTVWGNMSGAGTTSGEDWPGDVDLGGIYT
ncbi:MAG: hypothetical protein ACLFVX_04810 [Archaeoglobaceae archaeon]